MNQLRSFAPLYQQIKQDLLDQINQHVLKPGDGLPSEAQLAAQYNVSRITIRRAIKDLIQQGVLFSLQGKGTFVAQSPIRAISGFRSFSEDIRAKGLHPSSQVLRFEEETAAEQVASYLQIPPGDHVYVLERIRMADDQPMAFETAYLPVRLFPQLKQFDFNQQSLYTVLQDHYHIYPSWADAEIHAATATPEVARALGILPGEAVLIAHRFSYNEAFDILEYVVSIYCGNRFTFYTGRQSIA